MKVLVFDTETTGLPQGYNVPYQQSHRWPYIVQLSFLLYDMEENKIIEEIDLIVDLPHGVDIPEESSNIHGITPAISRNQGLKIKDVLEIFHIAIQSVDYVVAHNIDFDRTMIKAECYRNGFHDLEQMFTRDKQYFCTMLRSKNICNLIGISKKSGEEYVRYPKLMEVHEHLFNQTPKNLHDSFIDVIVCLRCFCKLTMHKDLCNINRRFNTLYNKRCV